MTRAQSTGIAALAVLLLAACGGTTAPRDDQTDAGSHDAALQDGQPVIDAPPTVDVVDLVDAGYLACFSGTGQLSDSLKTCQSDGDCTIQQEQTDCCGTILYVGVNVISTTMFQTCETDWVSHFPGCGCDSNKMTTEDGNTTNPNVDGGGPQVHCADFTMSGGICLTYTP
jgi:hypothetical protein